MKKPILPLAALLLALAFLLWPKPRRASDNPTPVPDQQTPVVAPLQPAGQVATTIAASPIAKALAASTNVELGRVAALAEPLSAFTVWADAFVNAAPAERDAMRTEGLALATARRPVLKDLIQSDPRAALQHAVPMRIRQELPEAIVAQLEDRVNDRASLRVYQGVGLDNRSPVPTFRIAETASGRSYEAHVYGRRAESVLWVADTSLDGIAIDQHFAVSEDPIRTLEIGERPRRDKRASFICPVSGKRSLDAEEAVETITEETPAIEAFGEITFLCDGSHAIIYRDQLIYAEGGTGGPIPFTGILPASPTPSLGNVKVLVIPMTFADQNDVPSSESALHQLMRDVGDHYAKASYGKLTLLTTVTPPVKLPHNEVWYIQKDTSNGGPIDGLGLEHSHARAEARKMGFDDDEFDCIVVRLRGGPRPVGGYGGGRSVWIYSDGLDLTAHEIGHAFGLAHANFWNTSGASAIGPGANEEYGGHWDVMGGIGLPLGHYNAQGKNQIKWLPDAFVREITSSGIYRVHAQDQAILDPANRYALTIRKDSLRTYWGELRGLYTGHATRTWADQGLILGWRYPSASGGNIQLLDTTPGSPFGKDDSPISLGRTFSDTEAGIHITTIGVNPATDEEAKSVDVVVNLGTFPNNTAPTLTLAASATVVPANVPVTFTATANDADGDVLAYSWQHFGDSNYRTISPNTPVLTRTFSASGTYVVSCTVSDMKGGAATRHVLVTVGNGNNRFTISGRVTLGGAGVPGVLVNANSANGVVTDSDGYYTIPNLTAGTYVMTPLLYGYSFSELFNNSVAVGPNFDGANFEAAEAPRVTITASVPQCLENSPGAPARFLIERTGDASQPLTVNAVAPIGTATSGTDYTLAPALAGGSQGFSTLTIPAGTNAILVSITPANDTAAEGPETVTLQLGPGNGYLVSGLAQATVVINDDDTSLPKVSLAIAEAKTVEGSSAPAQILFTRSGASNTTLNVGYVVAGTATSGVDYLALGGTISIPAGMDSASLSITSVNDAVSESLETVIVRITNSVSSLADPVANSATVAIVDDDAQVVTVVASDATAAERDLSSPGAAADTATFLVTRSGDLSQPLTIYYALAGMNSGSIATALHGVDYEALSGVLTVPAGQASGAVTIIPRADGLGEGPESVTLHLGAGPTNYRLGTPNNATATIFDAGDPPYVEVFPIDNAAEPNTAGRVRFSLKGSANGNVLVSYTVSGTATSGADFTPLTGTVSLAGTNVATADVTISPVNDALAEDLETVTVTIVPGAAYQAFGPTSSATVWLYDDEQPTLFVDAHSTVNPPTFNENSSGSFFYISRTGSTNAAVTVNYTLSGSAMNGTDYNTLSGTAAIPAGARGVDLNVVPINDAAAEGTESVTLTLAPGAYGRGPAATFYINDDESAAITIGFPSTSAAANESAGTANIPVRLSASAASTVTVEYQVDSGDRRLYAASGTAEILPYWVRADRNGSAVIGSISPDGVNWTAVSTQNLSLSGVSYLAGLYVCSFNSTLLSTCVFDNVVITNLQAGGSVGVRTGANIGSTALGGSAAFAGGTYTVAGAGDNVEGTTDQGYFAYWPINNSSTCTIIARVVSQQATAPRATAGVMIRESTGNNVRRAYMAATPGTGFAYHYRLSGGGQDVRINQLVLQPLWVRLQRSGATIRGFQSLDGSVWTQVGTNLDLAFGSEVLVGLTASSRAEGQLATATIDNVAITPGALPELGGRTVGFTAIQGTHEESAGVYTITASADGVAGTQDDGYFVSGYVAGDFTFTARITGMDSSAASPQAGIMVRESTRRSARTAFLGGVPGAAPELLWRAGTLTIGNGVGIDYTLAPGVLTFPPGTTTQHIAIAITNDPLPEPDETVMVILRNATGARIAGISNFTFVIVDDDAAPADPFAGFAASASTADENSGTVLVPATLSVPAVVPGSVDYTVSAGSATPGTDFTPASGTLQFAPGDTVRFVPVTLLNDGIIEATKTVLVTLNNPAGVRFNTQTNHTLTIVDDDSPVLTLTSTDTNATEMGDTALVTIHRAGPTNSALTVNLTRSGTATAGVDYTGIPSAVVLPAGATSLTLTLTPVQDTAAESTETAIISLAAGGGYVTNRPSSVTNFIADDDRNVVTIAATSPSAAEGGASGELTLTRSGDTSGTLTVSLAVSGTAVNGTDYTTTPASITSVAFAAGQETRTLQVNPVNDSVTEGEETVLVQINAGAYDIGAPGYASVTIVDNDIPPTVFIQSPGAQGVVIASSNGVEFTAIATDDGTPQPLSYAWTQVTGPGAITFETPSNAVTAASFSAPGVYLVRITVTDGQFTVSDQIAVNIGATNSLVPANWISSDIGPATARGFSGESGTNLVLSVTGSGFTTGSDRAHATTRQQTGDGSIEARLVSVNGGSGAEAGVSIRDSLHRYSRRGALLYQPSTRTLRFRARQTANTTDFAISASNLDLPLWLRLVRNATNGTVAAFHAPDNSGAPGAWTSLGTNVNITMDATADYSLTGASGSDMAAATAVFDHAAILPSFSGPASLAEDFGAGTQAGTYAYDTGTDIYTLNGSGSLDGSGFFRGEQFTGDFVLTVLQLDATSNANNSRSGIMIRDSMDNGAMVFFGRNPQGAFGCYVWRTNPGGGTASLNGVTQKTRWFRLIRRGNTITALHAPNNAGNVPGGWVQLGNPQTVFLQPAVMAGLYCDNAGGVGFNIATFTKLSIVPLHKAAIVDAGSTPANVSSPLALHGTVRDDNLPTPFVTEWTVAVAPGAVTFANSNALSTSASFTAGGAYTLRLWANDGVARSFDDLVFTNAADSPFAMWQAANFAGGTANPSAAPNADPDDDGINNAGEYAFGTDPNGPNEPAVIPSLTTNGASTFLRVTIQKSPSATDATITVEASGEVAPANWSATGLITETNTASLLRVRDFEPLAPETRRFFRVRVSIE